MTDKEMQNLATAMAEDIMDDVNVQARDHRMTGEQCKALIQAIKLALDKLP